MNTFFQRFWRTGVLTLFVGGMLILALGGYLTPVLRIASTPVISAQRWLASRYLAIFQAINSPQDMAALRQRSTLLEEENARLQSQVIELQQQLKDSEFKDELLGFARSRPEDTYVGANVIGRDPSPFLHYIFIDKGSDDGLVLRDARGNSSGPGWARGCCDCQRRPRTIDHRPGIVSQRSTRVKPN